MYDKILYCQLCFYEYTLRLWFKSTKALSSEIIVLCHNVKRKSDVDMMRVSLQNAGHKRVTKVCSGCRQAQCVV